MARWFFPRFGTILVSAGIYLIGLSMGHVLGQSAVSETGPNIPNFPSDLWEMAKAAGILGCGVLVLAMSRADKLHAAELKRMEEERERLNAERIQYRNDYNALVERVFPLVQQGIDAQRQLTEVLSGPPKRRQ